MRSEEEVKEAIGRYADTVKRICFVHLKNEADTEDIFQTVFLKYLLSDKEFESREHEKAWFIRVTLNSCKDLFKSFFRTHTEPLEALDEAAENVSPQAFEVISAVASLPLNYREAVYLYYYEGYTAAEIAEILKKKVNTVYTLLARAKKMLKKELGGEEDEPQDHNGV